MNVAAYWLSVWKNIFGVQKLNAALWFLARSLSLFLTSTHTWQSARAFIDEKKWGTDWPEEQDCCLYMDCNKEEGKHYRGEGKGGLSDKKKDRWDEIKDGEIPSVPLTPWMLERE